MLKHDPRVDAYIGKAPDYAKPILLKLRKLIHEADEELVEAVKWGAPTFVKHGLVCSFHAFNKHVAIWFHKGALLADPKRVLNVAATVSMRAAHFREPSDVAAPAMRALVKQAVKLNAAGVKAPRRAATGRTGGKTPAKKPVRPGRNSKAAPTAARRAAPKQTPRPSAKKRRAAKAARPTSSRTARRGPPRRG